MSRVVPIRHGRMRGGIPHKVGTSGTRGAYRPWAEGEGRHTTSIDPCPALSMFAG